MLNVRWILLIACCLPLVQVLAEPSEEPQPKIDLPRFSTPKMFLHPDDLRVAPTRQLIHPAIIKTAGRMKEPLGKYYLYYAPHKHLGISMAYADSLDGPWTEHKNNPVIEGASAPDICWIDAQGQFVMWGHRKNKQTEQWVSEDGIHFTHRGVAVQASDIGTRNATYTRTYKHPLKQFGSTYIMVYSGFDLKREIRCVWLAHSKDGLAWTPLKKPLIEPIEGENDNLYGPALLRWRGKLYVTYQDMTTWRGGNLKAVEFDEKLTPVGAGGKRHVLIDPAPGPPLEDRLRGAAYYRDDGKLYLFASAATDPRILVYATAKLDEETGE